MRTLFVAGIAPIVRDMTASQRFYVDDLGLPLAGDYPSSDRLDGVKHFGLWSLQEASRACFGQEYWPADIPTPQASLEFDVDDVTVAARELEGKGYTLLHPAKREPWGQTICRLLSPEGLLVGLSHTPWMRSDGSPSHEPHSAPPMMRSRTISISIARPAAQVYDFVSDPEHLPRWIASATVRKAGNEWVMEAGRT